MPVTIGDNSIQGLSQGGLTPGCVSGDTLNDNALYDLPLRTVESGLQKMLMPKGAVFGWRSSGITGALRIKLPRKDTSTMMRMRLVVYDYSSSRDFAMELGGYNFGRGNWFNFFGHYFGSSGMQGIPIRFGDDGNNDIIWIGETDQNWSYPQIAITTWMGGHSGSFGDFSWTENWELDIVTSFNGNVERTISSTDGDATVSDLKFKSDFETVKNAMDILQNINGYTYDRTDNEFIDQDTGLVAQEVGKVLPNAIAKVEKRLAIEYYQIYALMISAVQDLSKRITKAEKEIDKLEQEIYNAN